MNRLICSGAGTRSAIRFRITFPLRKSRSLPILADRYARVKSGPLPACDADQSCDSGPPTAGSLFSSIDRRVNVAATQKRMLIWLADYERTRRCILIMDGRRRARTLMLAMSALPSPRIPERATGCLRVVTGWRRLQIHRKISRLPENADELTCDLFVEAANNPAGPSKAAPMLKRRAPRAPRM
jgi:hypothetical protein